MYYYHDLLEVITMDFIYYDVGPTDVRWQPDFRDAFVQISGIEHHTATQASYWVDAMGGRRKYHGSDYRLHFHHTHNAEKVANNFTHTPQ